MRSMVKRMAIRVHSKLAQRKRGVETVLQRERDRTTAQICTFCTHEQPHVAQQLRMEVLSRGSCPETAQAGV